MQIHYWKIRGLASPLQHMCEYLEVPYEMCYVENRDDWVAQKKEFLKGEFEFANLPYVVDKDNLGDKKLSESIAIMAHINNRGKKENFTWNYSPEFFMIYGTIGDLKSHFTMNCYTSKDVESLKKKLTNDYAKYRFLVKIPALLNTIKDKKFFGGDDLCALDFYFAETCEHILRINKELELNVLNEEQKKRMEKFVEDFLNVEQIKKFRSSDRYQDLAYNNTMAVWR